MCAQPRRSSWCKQEDFEYENGLFVRFYFGWWQLQQKRRVLLFRGHLTTLFVYCFPHVVVTEATAANEAGRGARHSIRNRTFLFQNVVDFLDVVFTWRDRRVLLTCHTKEYWYDHSKHPQGVVLVFFVSRISMAFTSVIIRTHRSNG